MIIHRFHAMGTVVEVQGDERSGTEAQEMFRAFELRFSRFRSESELSLLNVSGGQDVSDEMRHVLELSLELRDRTAGLFDIGVGRAVHDWGYDQSFPDVTPLLQAPSCHMGEWCMQGNSVDLSDGTTLDLGGIAKGWASDRVVESGAATVVSAGGDVRSSDPSLEAEIVDESEQTVAVVHVGVGALATSSTRKRRWKVGNDEVHHLMDPRTMGPARTPVHAATVIAETAAEAEAGAKAVLLLGTEGLRWAEEQPWVRQAIVRWHDGSVYANTVARAS